MDIVERGHLKIFLFFHGRHAQKNENNAKGNAILPDLPDVLNVPQVMPSKILYQLDQYKEMRGLGLQ